MTSVSLPILYGMLDSCMVVYIVLPKLTLSPIPPDELLHCIHADRKRVHRSVPTRRDISLLKILFVDLIGVSCASDKEKCD